MSDLLIQAAEVNGQQGLDVLCQAGKIVSIGRDLPSNNVGEVLRANGGALLPGLHDHHIHLLSLAASRLSVVCGPPAVKTEDQLARRLEAAAGDGWIRGVGYHESVAGELTRTQLDRLMPTRPVRIQHRSGRLWFCNTKALEELDLDAGGSGHLFRQDQAIRRTNAIDDDLRTETRKVCDELLASGVTAFTDATPSNDERTRALFVDLNVPQHFQLMGNENLDAGPFKILLDDYQLPDFDDFCGRIAAAHQRNRTVAIHCVSLTEIVFTLSALKDVGVLPGDRIEHASVVAPELIHQLVDLGITVVTQPNFIFERGDQYTEDLTAAELAELYRCGSLISNGMPVGGGTDAPFGMPDPWAAMAAAVARETRAGVAISPRESISPERALQLFTSPLTDPGRVVTGVNVGDPADLCLLDSSWSVASKDLRSVTVRATVVDGRLCFDARNDEAGSN